MLLPKLAAPLTVHFVRFFSLFTNSSKWLWGGDRPDQQLKTTSTLLAVYTTFVLYVRHYRPLLVHLHTGVYFWCTHRHTHTVTKGSVTHFVMRLGCRPVNGFRAISV